MDLQNNLSSNLNNLHNENNNNLELNNSNNFNDKNLVLDIDNNNTLALDGRDNNNDNNNNTLALDIGNSDDNDLNNNNLALDIENNNNNIDNTLALDERNEDDNIDNTLALDGRDENDNNIGDEDNNIDNINTLTLDRRGDDNINNTLDRSGDDDEFFNDVFPPDGDENEDDDIYYDHLTLDENEGTVALDRENLILDLGSLPLDRDISTSNRNTLAVDENNFELNESGNNRNSIEKSSMTTSQISTVRKHPNIFPISNNTLKKIKPGKSWVWKYIQQNKLTKVRCCLVKIDNGDGTSNQCKTIFKPHTSTTNIAAHLRSVHRIYKDQRWSNETTSPNTSTSTTSISSLSKSISSISSQSELTTASVTSLTIDSIFENHASNMQPLPEKKQTRITYCLLAWIVEAMMPLDCINNERFQDLCYEINPRFQIPCINTIKNKMMESIFYTKSTLKDMFEQTMVSVCLTTDLWTHNHSPYIGVTAHWLTKDFIMHQALITLESFAYPHTGDRIEDFLRKILTEWNISDKLTAVATDNASSMIKAIRQLGTTHLCCTAHSIHLAISDGLSKSKNLIDLAKALNNFLVNRDKYRVRFRNIQAKLANNQEGVNILEPVSSDTVTRWNSTYFILKRLLELRDAIEELSKSLIRDPDRGIRSDGNILKEKILSKYDWQGLEELSNLLHPFAQASIYMSGSHYPTLSMMYPIMYRIFKHLNQIECNLTHISVIDTHKHIRESLNARWEDPKMTGWLATILDPRFKSLTIATSTMRNAVIHELRRKIMQSELFNSNLTETIVATSNNISSFFDDQEDLNSFSNIDTELQIYFSIPQIPKYDIGDPLYEKYNPLIWWNENQKTLPLLAEQARIFLGMPATSVPSERLFSDAGNVLTDKRNRLSANIVHDLLFLKENSNIINVYPGL